MSDRTMYRRKSAPFHEQVARRSDLSSPESSGLSVLCRDSGVSFRRGLDAWQYRPTPFVIARRIARACGVEVGTLFTAEKRRRGCTSTR